MITMAELCRTSKGKLYVILIVSAWTTYCISRYLHDFPDPVVKHGIKPELATSIVSRKDDKKLQTVPPGPESKTRNRENASKEAFLSIHDTRIKVKNEIQDFLHFIHKNESQLIPELGGVPIRCMLSTGWRSGSTFLGKTLAIHPGAFYHYEPLWKEVLMRRIRSLSNARDSLRELDNQLRCNYAALKRRGVIMLQPNDTRWFGEVEKKHSLEEISSYCSLYPVQIIKILRLGSRLLKPLLEDTSLNLRVILMVRDPRALNHSRKNVDFCFRECNDTTIICQDYYDDYKVLKELEHTFPGRIMGIRFEDITSNPEKVIPELYDFCGLRSSEYLQDYISAHTKPDHKDYEGKSRYSIFRNASNVSFEWKRNLTWTEIDEIQRTCTKAMDVWGYKKVDKDNMMNVETFTANIP